MADVTIRPSKNGPYVIEGPVELFDTEGNRITVDKPRIALCCSRSAFACLPTSWEDNATRDDLQHTCRRGYG